MTILLTSLFSFLIQNLRIEQNLEKTRELILERQNLQIRVQDLLTSLNCSNSQLALYTQLFPDEKTESLIVLFDNGIDPDPAFSGILLGRIYLDKGQNLCLATWPIDSKTSRPWRNEILLSQVLDLSFQFLGERQNADPKIKPVTVRTGWHPNWPKERNDLPSLLRLTVIQKDASLQFAFRLPTATPIVTYLEKGMSS